MTQRFRTGPQSDSHCYDPSPVPYHWAAMAFTSTHTSVRYRAEQWICATTFLGTAVGQTVSSGSIWVKPNASHAFTQCSGRL